MNPKIGTERRSQKREKQVREPFDTRSAPQTNKIVANDAEVHENEAGKRAEVQHFHRDLKPGKSDPGEAQQAHEVDTSSGCGKTRVDVAEYSARDDAVASHAIEKARSTGLSGERAGQSRNQQHKRKEAKHPRSTDAAADIENCRFRLREAAIVGPDNRREIYRDNADGSLNDANQDCRKADILFRRHRIFGKRRNSIEADVGERADTRSEQ